MWLQNISAKHRDEDKNLAGSHLRHYNEIAKVSQSDPRSHAYEASMPAEQSMLSGRYRERASQSNGVIPREGQFDRNRESR